jgi:hypothetical protein
LATAPARPAAAPQAGEKIKDAFKNRRPAMRTLGYITAVTMAAAATALGVLAAMSVPDARRYLKIKKM